MFGLISAIFTLAICHGVRATNYCDPNLCKFGNHVKPHIGCKNTGKFAATCQNPALVSISAQFQQNILAAHNDLRNKVANGTLPKFASAVRMPTLSWDTELSYLAELNFRRCQFQHDECRSTEAYKFAGQNMAIHYTTAKIGQQQYEPLSVMLINQWFNEHENAQQADVDECNAQSLKKNIGHFTAMIHEKTSKVGCAIATYMANLNKKKWTAMLLTCNYSFTNLMQRPIYVKGAKCSKCETGCSKEYNGLCSPAENVLPVP